MCSSWSFFLEDEEVVVVLVVIFIVVNVGWEVGDVVGVDRGVVGAWWNGCCSCGTGDGIWAWHGMGWHHIGRKVLLNLLTDDGVDGREVDGCVHGVGVGLGEWDGRDEVGGSRRGRQAGVSDGGVGRRGRRVSSGRGEEGFKVGFGHDGVGSGTNGGGDVGRVGVDDANGGGGGGGVGRVGVDGANGGGSVGKVKDEIGGSGGGDGVGGVCGVGGVRWVNGSDRGRGVNNCVGGGRWAYGGGAADCFVSFVEMVDMVWCWWEVDLFYW